MRVIVIGLLAFFALAASLPPAPTPPSENMSMNESMNSTGGNSSQGPGTTESASETGTSGSQGPDSSSSPTVERPAQLEQTVRSELEQTEQQLRSTMEQRMQSSLDEMRSEVGAAVRKMNKTVTSRTNAFSSHLNSLFYIVALLSVITLVNTGMLVSLYYEEEEVEGEVDAIQEEVSQETKGIQSSQVMDYVKRCRERGMSDREIARSLKDGGWSDDDVEKLFNNYT